MRNLVGLLATLLTLAVAAAGCEPSHATPAAPEAENPCGYDDELPYRLMVDAFNHKAGEVVCLHIDFVNDLPAEWMKG